MNRLSISPRHDWRQTAEEHGFTFHTPEDEAYWQESACYQFSLREIEDGLEDPAEAIEQMCFEVVAAALTSDETMQRLQIPEQYWDYIAGTWTQKHRNLYGRLDFTFDGKGPAKLYEYNADTPTSLYESAIFQWVWLEQAMARGIIPPGADQFNSLHEKLIAAFANFGIEGKLHIAAAGGSDEDWGTIEYLEDCARQAGLETSKLEMELIGLADTGVFLDPDGQPITTLFKLYPWEWLLREDFAGNIPASGCRFIEPAWKSILSNKGLLPLLWERFEGHPNLLPAYFEDKVDADKLGSRYVRKPIFSREGANIEFFERARDGQIAATAGPYGAEGHVLQADHPLPDFAGKRPMCGVWIVASEAAGLCIREDSTAVTTDDALFTPHFILG